MKSSIKKVKCGGFTLIELLTAMAITAILVSAIMQLTLQGIALWKNVNDDVNTTSTARIALQTMAKDLESFQMKPGSNNYEWFNARKDEDNDAADEIKTKRGKNARKAKRKKPGKLSYVPDSARFVFFACAPDRNPAVSSDDSLREEYRLDLASATDREGDPYLGDVNAVGYRLEYRDHIQNRDASDRDQGVFPVFALYRHIVSQRRTYDSLLCQTNLYKAFRDAADDEEQDIICDNVVEMNLTVNFEYVASEGGRGRAAEIASESVTVISSNGKGKEISVTGDTVKVNNKVYRNARLVSAHISVTVLTEEGAEMVERMRQGRARSPQPVDFFRLYTRQFSTAVTLPQPY